jgi:hypothetical protein
VNYQSAISLRVVKIDQTYSFWAVKVAHRHSFGIGESSAAPDRIRMNFPQ